MFAIRVRVIFGVFVERYFAECLVMAVGIEADELVLLEVHSSLVFDQLIPNGIAFVTSI